MSDTLCGSRIFEPFRALGLHSSSIAHATRYHHRHKEYYVFTVVGKVFHTYNCSKLGICQVSNQHPLEIECIAADAYNVFTACGKVVNCFQHNRQIKQSYIGHEDPVHLLLPFDKHIISVDRASKVNVWHIETAELYMSLEFSNLTFEITAIAHPNTYVNKIVFGSKQGKLQLWNISKNKMIYEYLSMKDSPITTIEQAPALDIVGIGNEAGEVTLLCLRTDKIILHFCQESGSITALSFRTDGETILAAGTIAGHVYLWDLDDKKLKGKIENAHMKAIAGLTFLRGQSLLLSNSGDNSLKVWEFDKGCGTGTLLRQRSGHFQPQTKIRFYKDISVVSAGSDSTLRIFSCIHPRHDKSLGQASLNRKQARKQGFKWDDGKLPPIVDFCIETARESQWDGVIAAHYHHPMATTWNLQCSRMGSHKFIHNDMSFTKSDNCGNMNRNYVTSVASTACGNFCLIGFSSGFVELHNIQSGIHRGNYCDKSLGKAHKMAVKGVSVDSLNQLTVTIGYEGIVKFWKFKSKILLGSIRIDSAPAFANLHRNSSMLSIVLDNFSFSVIDTETRKLVRHFNGHSSKINDLTWSEDGRWIITAGMDCCIKTWDLPSAAMIDCFVVENAVTSLALSTTSDMLATTHVDDVGIYLWSNRTLYSYVSLSVLPQDFHPEDVVDLPITVALSSVEEGTDAEEGNLSDQILTKEENVSQLDKQLITLSNFPYSKWANVLQLENIRLRNKPKEPPKVPKTAPFFLPTISSLTPHFFIESHDKQDKNSKLIQVNPNQQLSEFATALLASEEDDEALISLLRSMSLLAIDNEIRSLAPDNGGSVGLLETFLDFIERSIDSKRHFEIIQAYFSLFLSVHTEALSLIDGIGSKLSAIDLKLNKDRSELSQLLNQTQCIVNFIKSATL